MHGTQDDARRTPVRAQARAALLGAATSFVLSASVALLLGLLSRAVP
jgi:hypothetical protein